MKKRLLSVFLALCMCLTLLPTAALAAEVSQKPWETNPSEWTALDADYLSTYSNTIDGSTSPVKVYLTGNLTIDASIAVKGQVTLDLNGYTLTGPSSDTPALAVGLGNDSGNLTLKGGTVSAAEGGTAITIVNSSQLNADGGTVWGLVNNEGGTITRSSADVTSATTFRRGPVQNGGTIEWGTFNCAVENGYLDGDNDISGTITGGTFKVRVTNNKAGVIGEASGNYDRNNKISFPSGNYSNTLTNYGTIYSGKFEQGGEDDPKTINKSGGKIYGGEFSKLVNEAGGTIQPNNSAKFYPGSLINSGTVTLNITKSGIYEPVVDIGALTNNVGGTVDISTNTNLGSGSNAGTITVASGKILTLKGNMTNSGSITNHGTITNSSGTFTNSGSLTNDGCFSIKEDVLNSGTFTNYSETDGRITGGSVTCSNPYNAFRNDITGIFKISQLSSGTAYGSFSGTLENHGSFTHTKNTVAEAGQVPGLELVTNNFASTSGVDSDMDFDLYRTVSFDLGGDTDSVSYVPATQFVPDGEKAVKPSPAPTSTDGETVLFWFESGDDHDGSPFDFSTALTKPVSLRARWGDQSEIPYITKVVQGGSATPPAMSFTLEFFDGSDSGLTTPLEIATDAAYSLTGYTTETDQGEQEKPGTLSIILPGDNSSGGGAATADLLDDAVRPVLQPGNFSGMFVRQTMTGADTENWTPSSEVYFIALSQSDDTFVIYNTTCEQDPDGSEKYSPGAELAPDMIFTNTYTRSSGGGGGSGTTCYTIKSSAGEGGSISPVGNVSVRRNEDKTFTITPDTGYSISSVLVDGESVGAVSSYTFKSVRANHTIEARFTSASAPALPIIPGDLNSTDHTAYVQGFTDGLVRPNAPITRAQTAVMLYRLLTPERRAEIETDVHPFSDMTAQDWYCHEVATMVNGGYVSGFSDGTFRGNDPITRAQFVTILTRFIGQLDAECDFTDVPETHWAYTYIATATSAGWISGFADGSFCPDQTITRAQVMAIINRALNRGVDAESALPAGYKNYPDNPATAWHYYEVLEATNGHDYTGSRPSEDWTALH